MTQYEKYRGYEFGIDTDENPENPREMWDHLGTMITWHNRYDFSDKSDIAKEVKRMDIEERKKFLEKETVYLPLYLFDHSGITMRTTKFTDSWDSGFIGYVFVTKEKLREEYGKGKWKKKKILEYLKSEVAVFDQYLTGDVWGYVIEDGPYSDSLWGIYGYKEAIEQAKNVIDWIIKDKEQVHDNMVQILVDCYLSMTEDCNETIC